MTKRRKVAVVNWTIGQTRSGQKVMGDGDGRPIDEWIHKNAEMAGKTDQQWLDDAVTNLRNNGREDWMTNVPDLHGADDVKGLLDGVYGQYGDGKAAGSDRLLVAVAHPECLHSGQQAVCTGSGGIRVGVAQSPPAGEGDLTKDGLVIKKGTGDQTIDMT